MPKTGNSEGKDKQNARHGQEKEPLSFGPLFRALDWSNEHIFPGFKVEPKKSNSEPPKRPSPKR